MQIIPAREVHPVIVIGSGASGGMAAWNLTQQGHRRPAARRRRQVRSIEVLDARAAVGGARARWRAASSPPQFFLDTKEQPYLTPDGRPFELTRVWGHGGKTNVWGRVSLRYSEMDFKAAERDGWEIPWPISYTDIAPYYDQVEQLIGVMRRDGRFRRAAGQQVPAAAAGAALRRAAAAEGACTSSASPSSPAAAPT